MSRAGMMYLVVKAKRLIETSRLICGLVRDIGDLVDQLLQEAVMCWVLWLLFNPHDNPAKYNAFHRIVIWGSEKWKDSAKDTSLKVAKPNCEHTSFEFKSMASEHLTTLLVWILPEKPYHCPTRIWGNWHLSTSPFPHWLRFPLRWIPLKCEADRCKEMSQGQWTPWAWRDWHRVQQP